MRLVVTSCTLIPMLTPKVVLLFVRRIASCVIELTRMLAMGRASVEL